MSWLPLNAALGRRLAPLFIRFGITANQVTLLSLAAGSAGSAAFLRAGRAGMILGALGFLAANVLDECDGLVARATGTSSGFGSWLDTVVGCLVHFAFFATLGLGLGRQTGQGIWVFLGGLAAAGVLVSTVVYIIGQSVVRGKEALRHPDPPKPEKVGRFEFLKGMLRTDFSVVVLGAALLGRLHWILWGGAIGSFVFWIPSDVWLAARFRRGNAA